MSFCGFVWRHSWLTYILHGFCTGIVSTVRLQPMPVNRFWMIAVKSSLVKPKENTEECEQSGYFRSVLYMMHVLCDIIEATVVIGVLCTFLHVRFLLFCLIIKWSLLFNFTFRFGKCRRSSAAVKPDKYECDSGDRMYFCKILNASNTNETLSNSNLGWNKTMVSGNLISRPNPILDRHVVCSWWVVSFQYLHVSTEHRLFRTIFVYVALEW